jgi:integrase/recombinase XerD
LSQHRFIPISLMNRSKYQKQKDLFGKKLLASLSRLGTESYSPSTIRSYVNYTSDFLFYLKKKYLSETQVRRTDVYSYINHCKAEGNSPKLINRKIAVVRKYYSYLHRKGIVEKNPADGLILRTGKRTIPTGMLSEIEVQHLYESYQVTDKRTSRNKVILSLLVSQAVTTDDIRRLEPADIALREGKIRISGSHHERGRTLKLESHQILELQEYILITRPAILESVKKKNITSGRKADNPDLEKLGSRLLISMNGSADIKNSLMHLVKALKQINPKVRSCSHIRQSVITGWLKRYDLRTVQYMSGHKWISSTERYQVDYLEDLQESINKCHPLG